MSDLASRGIIRQGRARVIIQDVDALAMLAATAAAVAD
jgi:hypothetical protein